MKSAQQPIPDTTDTKAGDKPVERPFMEIVGDLTAKPMPRPVIAALLIALAISAVSIILVQAFDGAARMRTWIEGAGVWAPLAYIALKASTYVIAPLSGTPVKLAGGALFGFWEGAGLALVGDMLGASLNFWIARLFRDKGIRRMAGKQAIRQIDELTAHVGGWRALLAARLFLSSLYDFIAYAAGISSLPFRQFFWVSLLAGIPSTVFAAWVGNAAVSNTPFLYASFVVSAIALVTLLFLQHARGDRPANKPADEPAAQPYTEHPKAQPKR